MGIRKVGGNGARQHRTSGACQKVDGSDDEVTQKRGLGPKDG